MKTALKTIALVALISGFCYLGLYAFAFATLVNARLAQVDQCLAELGEKAGCHCSRETERETIEERVLELPDDGDTWHTILLLRPDWQKRREERRAEAMFESEPLLVSLRVQTHWHCITTDQAEFQKFAKLVDATPCLVVERANGQVVYRESGPELGKRPHGLIHAIRKEIERHCPDGKCLPLHPVPDPNGKEPADEIPAVLKEETPIAPPKPNPVPIAIVMSLGGVLGFAVKFRRAAGI